MENIVLQFCKSTETKNNETIQVGNLLCYLPNGDLYRLSIKDDFLFDIVEDWVYKKEFTNAIFITNNLTQIIVKINEILFTLNKLKVKKIRY